MKSLNTLAKEIHECAIHKGWWTENRNDFEIMSLIHSEVSEAVEDLRMGKLEMTYAQDGKPEGLSSELADIIIRVLDYAERKGIDMDEAVRIKMKYNETRSHRHGGKLA